MTLNPSAAVSRGDYRVFGHYRVHSEAAKLNANTHTVAAVTYKLGTNTQVLSVFSYYLRK